MRISLAVRGTISAAAIVFAPAAHALPAPQSAESGGVAIEYLAAPVRGNRDAQTEAANYLRSIGLREGWNKEKGIWIAIGTGSIDRAPGEAGWCTSREIAFLKAVADAKRQAAQRMGTAVQTAIERRTEAGDRLNPTPVELASAQANNDAPQGVVDKVVAILNYELDKELEKRMPPKTESPAEKMAREAKEAEERRELTMARVKDAAFKSRTEVVATSEAAAMQCFRSFEEIPEGSKGSIAVILAYNDGSRRLAEALMGKSNRIPTGAPGTKREDLTAWAEGLSDEALLYSLGCQVRQDETGELVLVAFGQGSPPIDDEDIYEDARLAAEKAAFESARQFVGEMVKSDGGLDRDETLRIYKDSDGSVEKIGETRQRSYDRFMSSGSALVLRGGDVLRRWTLRHPRSSVPIFGVIKAFSLSGAQEANRQRQEQDAIGGSKGGRGVTSTAPPRSGTPGSGKSAAPAGGSTGGAGAEPAIP